MINNVGTFAQNEFMRMRLTETQAEFNNLQGQVSSGKKSQTYSGLREDARLSLSLRITRTSTEAFQQANVVTKTRMEQTQTVFERLKDIANSVRNSAFPVMSSANISPTQGNAALRAQATAALQEVTHLINTHLDGFYLFAGRMADAPPMADPGSPTLPGTPLANVTSAAGVTPLDSTAASGDAAYDNIVAHLDGTAVGAISGAIPVRYYSGEYSATSEALIVARVESGFDITYGINGRDNSVNKIMQALYALSVGDLTPSTDAGYRQMATRAVADLQDGFDGVIEEIGELGVKQTQLQELATRQKDFMTTLDIQIGDVEDVDMAEAISRLTFTQTSLEASYRMLSASRDMSLASYL